MTTEANEIVKPFHDRMTVILDAKAVDFWLNPGGMTEEIAARILVPTPKAFLVEFEVSTVLNSPRTDQPACIKAVV